jgi:hypothetical protein
MTKTIILSGDLVYCPVCRAVYYKRRVCYCVEDRISGVRRYN